MYTYVPALHMCACISKVGLDGAIKWDVSFLGEVCMCIHMYIDKYLTLRMYMYICKVGPEPSSGISVSWELCDVYLHTYVCI